MADNARKWTDKQLAQMEKHIHKEYLQANKELTEKWNNWKSASTEKYDALQKAWKEAIGTDLEKDAHEELLAYGRSMIRTDAYYRELVEATAMQLTRANQTAVAYLNGQMPSIYAKNYAQVKPSADVLGINFKTRSEATVKRLITQKKIKLPKKKLSIPKDLQWNTKKLNSAVLQGVLQGDSIQQIAKRIKPIVGNNEQAAIRNARTMVTGAENQGRMDSYHQLEEDGVVLKKVWIATADGRTREWHLSMDGQEVDIDENFVDGEGNELAFPGDPSADPSTVYNCRCSMKTHIVGFRRRDGSVEKVDIDSERPSFHGQQIDYERGRRRR